MVEGRACSRIKIFNLIIICHIHLQFLVLLCGIQKSNIIQLEKGYLIHT